LWVWEKARCLPLLTERHRPAQHLGKEVLAKELGANHYIDSTTQNVADAL
jgi:hypothetical protein